MIDYGENLSPVSASGVDDVNVSSQTDTANVVKETKADDW